MEKIKMDNKENKNVIVKKEKVSVLFLFNFQGNVKIEKFTKTRHLLPEEIFNKHSYPLKFHISEMFFALMKNSTTAASPSGDE
jgi:hypothetical protein